MEYKQIKAECILKCLYNNMNDSCRVKGLATKKKHRFRVLAENLAGHGKPSAETDPILIKDPIGMLQ